MSSFKLSAKRRALLEVLLKEKGVDSSPIERISRRTSGDPVPLSFAQARLWFLDELMSGSALFNISTALRLKGSLNVAAFEQSLNEIIKRHEALRTNVVKVDGQPFQAIAPTSTLTLPVVNLQEFPEVEREAEVLRLAREEARRPFNLERDRLLRATLLRLNETEHVVLFTIHHLVSDDLSIGILIRELTALYEACDRHQPSPLPELPIQYPDFALWQQQWLQGEVFQNQLSYWKQQLGGHLPILQLPTDYPRPAVATFRGASQSFSFTAELTEALKALSQKEDATLFMILLAAFKTLLYRYTGSEDVVVGSPIANRNRAEIEGLIGCFVNTLALRTDLSGNPTFRALLRRVREVTLGAYAHQDLPFEKLVEELQPERNLSYTPLFQVMFVMQDNVSMSALDLSGLTWNALEIDNDTTKFDVTLRVTEVGGRLVGTLEYSTDLFDTDTITRMMGHLQTLLEGIVTNSDQPLSTLPLLTLAEQQQLLEWNQTQTDYPVDVCLHELFEAQVERTPNAVAVVFEGKQLTYRELNQRANQLAHYLRGLGVKPDVLVGICVERSLEMVVGLLAILKADGAYVPLDPAYPQERLAFMLSDSQVPVLLTQARLLETLPAHPAKVICLDTDWDAICSLQRSTERGSAELTVEASRRSQRFAIAQQSQENPLSRVTANNLAYVIYTSGSTGKPKGAMNTHQGICNRLLWMQDAYQLRETDRVLQKTPFSFDVSVWEFFWPLLNGARLVVAQPGGHQDSAYLVKLIASQQITTLHFVPSMLQIFLEEQGLEACTSLKRVICSGEALPKELQQRFFTRLDAELHNLYGPTEAAIDVTFWKCDRHSNLPVVPIGRPIASTQIYLLDCEGQLVPIGVPGELHIGGKGLARGYLNRPELTAEKFINNPFVDFESGFASEQSALNNPKSKIQNLKSTRLYKTGDLARYLPDGNIEFLGRIDHQVKIRGFRIELEEIEAVLGEHPGVRASVVVVREDEPNSKRLVAYAVLDPEQALTITDLRRFLEEKLPNYMVPSAFVILEALPLTPNGKVDRRSLPAPDLVQFQSENPFVAPQTLTEEMLAGIWAEVLGIEKVGIHDNFFELGGHSLLASRVISQVRKVFEVEIPLRHLFESPTVAELAQDIETATQAKLGLAAPPIKYISRDGELPLSFAQKRLWFLTQLEPDSPFYNIPAAFRLQGQLNRRALEQSLNEILRRHEVLRTSFKTVKGQPVPAISQEISLFLSMIDLSELPEAQRETQVRQLALAEAQQPFDLDTSPILRVKLLRLSEQEHVVLFTMHHIVSDGWSIGVLVREVTALYQAFCTGEVSPLPELPIQYADFAAWQQQWLQGEVLEAQLSYWRQHLRGASPVLELPTDHSRPAVQTFQGATYSLKLPQQLCVALKVLSQQEGSTLFMTLLAGFKALLYRYTGSEDIVVGSPIANRNRAEIEGLIGCFVNTLVLRTELSGNPTCRELLRRVREVTLEAYAHQDLPFEKLVEELQPERNLSYTPLFQVMFVLQNAPMSALEISGLTLSSLESDRGTAQFDLTLSMEEVGEELIGTLEYNTDLFEADTITRMAGHLQTLLEGIVANPDQPLSTLPLLTLAEQQQLLEWNQTQADYPVDLCIHQLFEAQVEQTPDAIAAVFEDQQLTYGELNVRANQLAHHLQKLGVKPEVLVGICVERSLDMVVGVLGILKAGGAYVPLDPAYPKERLAFMLEDAQVSVLLTQQWLLEILPEHTAKIVCLDADWETIQANDCSLIENSPPQPPLPRGEYKEKLLLLGDTDGCKGGVKRLNSSNLAYVIYTSGSIGKPKGVQISHRALVNFLCSMRLAPGLTEQDVLLAVTTLSFDIAGLELYLPLIVGARVVIASREVAVDGIRLSELLTHSSATVMQATPATWRLLLAAGWQGNKPLKILCGGEALSRELANQLLTRCDSLWNLYGPTETTIWSTLYQVKSGDELVPIGHAIANTQLYILDHHLQPTPVGVPGELYIGGAGVARGYLNRPELTAERFISNPFSDQPEARLYKTGDLARYLPNGDIEYLGRIDHQVKIRGFRIELGEIETALAQYPGVQQAVVLAREDNPGLQRLVAYIVPREEQTLKISELRSFLKKQLPDYMIPSAFVLLSALPLTPNGKVDRRALPAPEATVLEGETVFVAPRTPVEEVLTNLWAEVLNLERVGIHDNFFELGGHSLLATQLISRIRDTFQIELALRCLFESPTVAELSDRIEASRQTESELHAPPLVPVSRSEELPLSFAQARLWFLDRIALGNCAYNIPAAVRLTGLLNVQALQQSLNEIVRRHEALRTIFAMGSEQPIQVIAPNLTLPLPIVDLRELPEAEQQAKVQQLAVKEAQCPFDLERDPLLRATLLQLGETEHIVLLTMHHIVSDGWSMGVLVREVATLYEAFSCGKSSPLPELPIQYTDFAVWQRQWLQREMLDAQLSYWKQHLAGAPATLNLPTDRSRPAVQTFRGATSRFVLPKDLSDAIANLSRQEGVTLFMLLLAAFQTLLHRYTNQEDIVVGTDVANRNRSEVEPLIGFFVNLLVLRTDLSGNPSFRELLKRVREVTLGAYAHQDLPFAKLVEALGTERNLNHTPLFQVLFVLQNAPMPSLELSGLTLTSIEIETGTAKFDLALFMEETEQGIIGTWNYSTDLFNASTITRMSGHLETLLSNIVAQPDTPIKTLAMLSETEKQQQILEQEQRKKAKFNKFKSVKPKAVSLPQGDLVKTDYLTQGETLPLVLQPTSEDIDFVDWAKSDHEFIETQLLKHGAILFRGFNINSASEFETVAQAICPELFGEYGDLPREGVGGKVYGSTPYPADKAILFHNESSHLQRFPLKIWFFCVQPAQQGGETPIVDCRKIYQLLDPKLREQLVTKQLMYVRNYIEGLDVSWQDFFRTTDKAVVEKYCYKAGIDFEWLPENGLRTRQIRPAIAKHPKTGELVFFNQIQLHHLSFLDPTVRDSLLSLFGEEKLPRNVYYGDGSPFEESVIQKITEIYQRSQVSFPWQKGDILMLDNMLTAHGRNPYVGSRKIVVAMGEMINF